jgi:hypothetical protein
MGIGITDDFGITARTLPSFEEEGIVRNNGLTGA